MISSSLLALSFGSPWLLLGAALAAIPAILHLLFRREHRAEPFAANRFLAEATRKHSRRLRFQHWVLLAVRMAILMLIAIALARPTLQDSVTQTPAGRAPIHHLFVLDATLSMRHRDRGQQRFDRGRAILQKTVETAHDGDTFRLLVIRAAGTPVVIAQAAGRRGDVLEELARLEPTWNRDAKPKLSRPHWHCSIRLSPRADSESHSLPTSNAPPGNLPNRIAVSGSGICSTRSDSNPNWSSTTSRDRPPQIPPSSN